ncbi:MAG TPA: DUF6754 domain-containing protein [Candidatus Mcinerneyibacterium sp.]|nr:DUF6754 domain-containing protein [Candidatus Mcinerneyibacterium sp.]
MRKYIILFLVSLLIFSVFAQETNTSDKKITPKAELVLQDRANDGGTGFTLTFKPQNKPEELKTYFLRIYKEVNGEEILIREMKVNNSGQTVRMPMSVQKANTNVIARAYYQKDDEVIEFKEKSLSTKGEWVDSARLSAFIAAILFISMIFIYVKKARSGEELFVRRIPGLGEINDAIGRATEMGKPVFYIPGTSTIRDVATLASLNILRSVGRKAAEYTTPMKVLIQRPLVLGVAQEVVQEAYMSAGRPDLYNEDDVYLAAAGQFAFASAAQGAMVREKPGAVFLLGMFWAESLLLAETANSVGAIQIAGTDATSQIPFFIAACDYTLIGEELYAASAYLSREPKLLGTLKAQDYFKGLLLIITILALFLDIVGVDIIVKYILS